MEKHKWTAKAALEKLKSGNEKYLSAKQNDGDISIALRQKTAKEGQNPYAVVVTCADSRIVPEHIFMSGLGELFVIRVAGNVIGEHELGSIEYATSHLGCPIVLVLGHTHCGAIQAAMDGGGCGYTKILTDRILFAIGEETDEDKACRRNVAAGVKRIRECLSQDFQVSGAIYHTESGKVEFATES